MEAGHVMVVCLKEEEVEVVMDEQEEVGEVVMVSCYLQVGVVVLLY